MELFFYWPSLITLSKHVQLHCACCSILPIWIKVLSFKLASVSSTKISLLSLFNVWYCWKSLSYNDCGRMLVNHSNAIQVVLSSWKCRMAFNWMILSLLTCKVPSSTQSVRFLSKWRWLQGTLNWYIGAYLSCWQIAFVSMRHLYFPSRKYKVRGNTRRYLLKILLKWLFTHSCMHLLHCC